MTEIELMKALYLALQHNGIYSDEDGDLATSLLASLFRRGWVLQVIAGAITWREKNRGVV